MIATAHLLSNDRQSVQRLGISEIKIVQNFLQVNVCRRLCAMPWLGPSDSFIAGSGCLKAD